MFGFASRIMAWVVKRTAVVLALALPTSAWMIIAVAAPQALACDNNSHCYAVAYNSNTNANHGIYGQLNVHCLYEPDNGYFATTEIWDTDSGGNNWVEAGLFSGAGSNINYGDRNWFWAEKRPGYNYVEYDSSVTASTDTRYTTEITFAGDDSWEVFGENSFVEFGTSTNNSATLVQGIGGTEYLGNSTSGIRDIGDVYNLQRENSSNTWYNWNGNAVNHNLGTGNYINGNYDSASDESWSGPC